MIFFDYTFIDKILFATIVIIENIVEENSMHMPTDLEKIHYLVMTLLYLSCGDDGSDNNDRGCRI